MPLGLYISVPFCRTKCSYCNFASDVFSKSSYEKYVVRLLEDITHSRQLASKLGCDITEDTVDSIYLGGGTPSILDGEQLLRIFAGVRQEFPVDPAAEITVECAPGTLTPALIEALSQCGVNRVSLGVQSFVDQEAQSVGRLHKRSTVLEEITRLRAAGIANISIDLIAGLPHQTAESWAYSVAETLTTGVPHASVYMLEVDDDSRLGRELIAGGARYHAHFVPSDDATADFYQQACDTFAAAGFAQYEISNFARAETRVPRPSSAWAGVPDNQSRHNLKYWTRQPYLGFGVDAHSMLALPLPMWGRAPSGACPERSRRVQAEQSSPAVDTATNSSSAQNADSATATHPAVRFATPDSLDAYMNRVPPSVTPVSAEAAIEEAFFLGLRLNRGIDLERIWKEMRAGSEVREREGHDFSRATSAGTTVLAAEAKRSSIEIGEDAIAHWQSALEQCQADGLVEQQGTTLRLSSRGRLLSNEVFARFLAEENAEENKVGTGHVNPR